MFQLWKDQIGSTWDILQCESYMENTAERESKAEHSENVFRIAAQAAHDVSN